MFNMQYIGRQLESKINKKIVARIVSRNTDVPPDQSDPALILRSRVGTASSQSLKIPQQAFPFKELF